MTRTDQLARIEQGQSLQIGLLMFIAWQFAPAWSTSDVVVTLIAGALVGLGAWLAWKLMRVIATRWGWRALSWGLFGLVLLVNTIRDVWPGLMTGVWS